MASKKRAKKDWFPAEIVVYSVGKILYIADGLDNLANGEEVATYELKRKGRVKKTVGIAYTDAK